MSRIIRNFNELNEISYKSIGAAYKVHRHLGPGLLESAYEACLAYELSKLNLVIERQKPLPLIYGEIKLDVGYRIDILVENSLVLELKSVTATTPVDVAQLMTYLKLSKRKLGLLMNFNVANMQKGIGRYAM